MNRTLWVLQIVTGLLFLFFGVFHYLVPEDIPTRVEWMHDLSSTQHYLIGTLEILGGLGLILPGLAHIATWLTPMAGAGLLLIMLAAVFWHIGRDEYANAVANLSLTAILGFIAYFRWRVQPLPVHV